MSAKTAARAPLPCAGCQARAEEIAFLRERVQVLEAAVIAAPAPPAPAGEAPGVKADPDTFIGSDGTAMVMIDGVPVPWTEWRRGEDALAAALAGKCVEIPAAKQ